MRRGKAAVLGGLAMAAAMLSGARAPAAAEKRVEVVATIYPLYDWARVVGGERVSVTQLLPPGVEAHAFAPKPSDVLALNRARVFLFLGGDLEPWAADVVEGLDNANLAVIEAGRGVDRAGGPGHTDPHVWLDPVLAQSIVSAIAEGLAGVDPEGREVYATNAARYRDSLQELHAKIAEGLKTARYREILFAGHFAFGYFARRYGLTYRSPYPGFSPNAAPTPAQVAAMIKAVKESGQTTVFYEELLDPKIGRTIAEETGARLVLLHGAHNLSREDRARGDVTYRSIMEENLAKLRAALDAR